MSGHRLAIESDAGVPLDEIVSSGVRGEPDIFRLASLDQHQLCVMVWYYHDDDLPGPDAKVALILDHFTIPGGKARLEHYRIDENHGNAFAAWRRMGSGQQTPRLNNTPTWKKFTSFIALFAEPADENCH